MWLRVFFVLCLALSVAPCVLAASQLLVNIFDRITGRNSKSTKENKKMAKEMEQEMQDESNTTNMLVASYPRETQNHNNDDNPNYKIYKLQMQRCRSRDKNKDHGRTIGMHGLWPQWEQYCHGEDFDLDKISDLRPKMEEDWFSCEGEDRNVWFWKHEWLRHGKCSVAIGDTADEHAYFAKGLELHDKFGSNTDICPENADECSVCLKSDEDWKIVKCPPYHPPHDNYFAHPYHRGAELVENAENSGNGKSTDESAEVKMMSPPQEPVEVIHT